MGRLRFNREAEGILRQHPEFVVEKYVVDKTKPLMLEIGMGKGDFLLEMARRNPEINFLGLEKFTTVMVKALKKWMQIPVENLKMQIGCAENLDELLPENCVDCIFLNFSDPWPKERHSKRRLLHPGFLAKYARILKPNGKVQFKTDNDVFFHWFVQEVVPQAKLRVLERNDDLADDDTNVQTEYERKFRKQGIKIKKIVFQIPKN